MRRAAGPVGLRREGRKPHRGLGGSDSEARVIHTEGGLQSLFRLSLGNRRRVELRWQCHVYICDRENQQGGQRGGKAGDEALQEAVCTVGKAGTLAKLLKLSGPQFLHLQNG